VGVDFGWDVVDDVEGCLAVDCCDECGGECVEFGFFEVLFVECDV